MNPGSHGTSREQHRIPRGGDSILSQKELSNLSRVDIHKVRVEELVDLNDIVIDSGLTKNDRLESFMEQIHNPYCCRAGDTKIKMEYAEQAPPLQEVLIAYFIRNV